LNRLAFLQRAFRSTDRDECDILYKFTNLASSCHHRICLQDESDRDGRQKSTAIAVHGEWRSQ